MLNIKTDQLISLEIVTYNNNNRKTIIIIINLTFALLDKQKKCFFQNLKVE